MDEQLTIMENTLVDMCEISIDEIDSEMINKLFRAMHTMKGNAGMFGFDDVVSFAHVAENLLDEIRNEKIKLTQDMIDLFLIVNDHSKTLIDITVAQEKLDDDQLEHHNDLLRQLGSFLGNEPKQVETHKNESVEVENNSNTMYQINIKLKEDFFTSGMDIVSIIKYLNIIGDITKTTTIDTNIPIVSNLTPLNAYLSISLEYETEEPEQEIIDAFEFVQEDIELEIINLTKKQLEKEQKVVEPIVNSSKKPAKTKKNNSKSNSTKNFSLRVDSSKVDTLINKIGEMVISNAKIIQYAIDTKDSDFEEIVMGMSTMIEDVRDGIMNIRMVQVGDSFNKLRRIVNDTAKKTGKDISFEIFGADTELDKTVVEKISDPLVHMLRNSVDHGIEMPQIRIDAGKNPKGIITLKAYPDAGSIVIEIKDDGAGINKDIIFNKAIEKGIIDKDMQLSDSAIYNLIFAPGFSTAEAVTDVSGRGVGMDVVKRNIDELRGTVDIQSKLGFGTLMTIRLPLTLAIIDGFLVQVGTKKYIIPLDMIKECIELTKKQRKRMKGNDYITLRKEILPVLDVREYFEEDKSKNKRENIVVVKYGKSQIGLKVDELYGEFQTVIKPLGELFENIAGISGGTILGSGEIALIFDIPKLIEYKIMNKESKKNGN
jgi:two-component system chemotaxis sensor kinase CheA